jgi:hypothetical protein
MGKDIWTPGAWARKFPPCLAVDFCTQGEYPPLQYEGDAQLAHYWFVCHSGTVRLRPLCLLYRQIPRHLVD